MPGRNYSDFIRAYTDAYTPRGEAPEKYHFWTAVHVVAGVLRRRVYVDAGAFRWYPNFYVVLVAPPGIVKKSTVINYGARLLRDIPGICIGADITTWQAFVEEVAGAKDYLAEGGAVGDAPLSDEELASQIAGQTYTVTSAISVQTSELGTFLDTRDTQMMSVMTELFDSKLNQGLRKATKTQGDNEVMNPFVNWIAGTTPDWLEDNFRTRVGGHGLSSRIIFVHAKKRERRVAFPHKLWEQSHLPLINSLVEDLKRIATLQGPMRFSPEADAIGEEWYDNHAVRQELLADHPHRDKWLQEYLARKWDHMMKLCTVLSVSRRDDLLIDDEIMREAIARADQVEDELYMVFTGAYKSDQTKLMHADVWNGVCLGLLRNGGEMEDFRLYGFVSNYMTGGRATELLRQWREARWLKLGAGGLYSFDENCPQIDPEVIRKAEAGRPEGARPAGGDDTRTQAAAAPDRPLPPHPAEVLYLQELSDQLRTERQYARAPQSAPRPFGSAPLSRDPSVEC